jgi:hypothetical protein
MRYGVENCNPRLRLLTDKQAYQGAGSNWERHALGILEVLQVRGPAAHQRGLAHAMFLDARFQGVRTDQF